MFLCRWQIGIGKHRLIFVLSGIVAPRTARLISKRGNLAFARRPLKVSVRGDGDVLRVRRSLLRPIREDRSLLVDRIDIAASRTAGSTPKPAISHAGIPVRTRWNGLNQRNRLRRSVLDAEEEAWA